MHKKRKIWMIAGGLALCLLLLWGLDRADRRTTYIESSQMNISGDSSIAVADNKTVLRQEFVMPYELLTELSFKTGTFGRNNNSFWRLVVTEKNSGKPIFENSFNASQVSDGAYYSVPVGTAKRVKKGELYTLAIQSENATGNSALAFYVSEGDAYREGQLYLNEEATDKDLCFQVYGARRDAFWPGLYMAFLGTAVLLAAYFYREYKKGRNIIENKLLWAVITGILYLILTYAFTRLNMGTFTDECDNIRGGMLIAKGKVLYRDYYAQHTPFAYYLCALFALLGAGSIPQFRILYFILNSVVWGGLCYRHSRHFGRMRMVLLPAIQVILTMGMFFQGSKIMGDNIQGLCMVALALEFLRYLEDRELTPSRCLIVAAGIFCSVMSAFVSVFALASVIVGVLVWEVLYWKDNTGFCVKNALRRYGMLVTACLTPFAITFIYFLCNHAIRQMYLMAYQFNTIVYKNYQNEFGRVKWKPFVLGVKNYFTAITDNVNSLITAAGNETAVMQLVLVTAAGVALVLWAVKGQGGKRIFPAVCLFLCMTGNATRSSTDFHGVAFYYVAVTLILVLGMEWEINRKKPLAVAWVTVAALYMCKPYVVMIADHIVYRQSAVEGIDKQVVEMTSPGDLIFIDAFVHDSIYLLYKERYPANRNCYILPWYMDWFEFDTIEDLEKYQPKTVIYQPELEVYGQTDFCPNLHQMITSRYIRQGEDSVIWKLK